MSARAFARGAWPSSASRRSVARRPIAVDTALEPVTCLTVPGPTNPVRPQAWDVGAPAGTISDRSRPTAADSEHGLAPAG